MASTLLIPCAAGDGDSEVVEAALRSARSGKLRHVDVHAEAGPGRQEEIGSLGAKLGVQRVFGQAQEAVHLAGQFQVRDREREMRLGCVLDCSERPSS